MVMGTRKRRAVTYGKCESVDSDEVVRLKEELKEAKRLLDEAHACMVSGRSGICTLGKNWELAQ